MGSPYSDAVIAQHLHPRGGMTPGQAINSGTAQLAAAYLSRQEAQKQKAEQQAAQQQSQQIARLLLGGPNPANAMAPEGGVQTTPQMKPDQNSALAMALQNPQALQANPFVAQLLMSQFKPQDSPFSKIDPKDYTPESVKGFVSSGGKDYTHLRSAEKAKEDNIESYFATVSTGGKQIQARVYESKDGATFMLGAGGRKVPLSSEQISAPITRQEVRQGQLTASTITDLQKDIAGGDAILAQLDSVKKSFDPSFLTYTGRARLATGRILDKAGVAPESEKQFVQSARKFNQGVSQVFNDYRRQITGAAAAISELAQLKDAILNTDLGPTEFEAAFDQFYGAIQKGNAVRRELLEKGLQPGTPEFGKAFDEAFTGLTDAERQELEALENQYGDGTRPPQ